MCEFIRLASLIIFSSTILPHSAYPLLFRFPSQLQSLPEGIYLLVCFVSFQILDFRLCERRGLFS